jgi:hypothetical protein
VLLIHSRRLDHEDLRRPGHRRSRDLRVGELGILAFEVRIDHPTGDCAGPSDVYGDLVVDHLGKRLAERRPPHGGDVVGHRSPHHDRAVTGQLDADLVSGFLETVRGFYAGARMGLHYAITCNEFVDRIRPDEIEPATRGSYLGSWRVKNQMAACKDWPKTDLPADYFEPFRTDVPAVLISGDTDPAAPPRWGEEVKSFRPFPRARKACVSR